MVPRGPEQLKAALFALAGWLVGIDRMDLPLRRLDPRAGSLLELLAPGADGATLALELAAHVAGHANDRLLPAFDEAQLIVLDDALAELGLIMPLPLLRATLAALNGTATPPQFARAELAA